MLIVLPSPFITINRFQVLLSRITCLPSYPIGLTLEWGIGPIQSANDSQRPLSHSLYLRYKNGLRTPVQYQFSLELGPAVLTASPILINFGLLSFCPVSGNSFPTCACTKTPPSLLSAYGLLLLPWSANFGTHSKCVSAVEQRKHSWMSVRKFWNILRVIVH